MLYQKLCQKCGGDLRKVGNTHYACVSCNTTYSTEKIEGALANAKQNLYKAVSADNISKDEVKKWCDEVKKYLPDDFQANFYYDYIEKPEKEVLQIIMNINVEEQYEYLETLIVFVIKSLKKAYVAAIKELIESIYKDKNKDKYNEYTSKVEEEAEKLDKCVYVTKIQRAAFIAYSSKDKKKAMELVEYLERQNLKCFISSRNLRHGVGSREYYDEALKEAMDYCTTFVFVSSMNSRNVDCDAFKIEMPYIIEKDKKNAPGNLRNDYSKIPKEYKKHRVEYRIEESKDDNDADDFVDDFFCGYERVHSIKEVSKRIIQHTLENPIEKTMETPIETPIKKDPPVVKKVKFCVDCQSKCDEGVKECDVCGGTNFASSLNEAKKLKKEEKDRQKKRAKIQKEQEKANKNNLQESKVTKQTVSEDKNKDKDKDKDKKSFSFVWILPIIAIIALVVLSFVFTNLRAWFIASAIGIACLSVSGIFPSVSWYRFSFFSLSIASAVLVHFSSTFGYAMCFAITLVIEAILFSIAFKKTHSVTSIIFWTIAGILLLICIGTCFTGLAKALILGIGMGIIHIILAVIAFKNDNFLGFPIITLALLGILSLIMLAFSSSNGYCAIFILIASLGGVIEIVFLAIEDDEIAIGTGVGAAILVLCLLGMAIVGPKPNNEIKVQSGVLNSYGGNKETITIPDEVLEIGMYAFSNSGPKDSLKEVVFHDRVTKIGMGAFKNCDKLESITIPGSITEIDKNVFSNCDNLKTVTLEQGIISTGDATFSNCKSLEKVTLPNSLTTIEKKAFYKCKNLQEVFIPASVTSIGNGAFEKCNNLSKIYYAGSEEQWQNIEKNQWISIGDEYCEYEIIYNYVPEVNAEDVEESTETNAPIETSEPAMYCILPKKSKEVMPIA